MGLGPAIKRTTPDQAAGLFTAPEQLRGFPAVPVPGPKGSFDAADSGSSDATRLLCAAAHLRPEWDQRIAAERAALTDTLIKKHGPGWLQRGHERRRDKAAREKAADADALGAPTRAKEQFVPLGADYARWVRTRVLAPHYPVPSHGFDLAQVAAHCGQSLRLTRNRRALVALAAVLGALWWHWQGVTFAPVVLALGCWLAYYGERVWSQRLLRRALGQDADRWRELPRLSARHDKTVRRVHALEGQPVIPYQQDLRPGAVRYHFLGAGRVWFESGIGIDVMSPPPRSGEGRQQDHEAITRLLPNADRIMAAGEPGTGIRPFTPDDLLAHVGKELARPIAPDRVFHPDNRQDVFPVATIGAKRWPRLAHEQWAQLVTLAHDGVRATGAHQAPKVARRYLCARMVSWDGELVACVFVSFSYENHYLRVIVRPQVVNPVHPALTGAWGQADRAGWRFHVRSLLLAGADSAVATWHLVKPRPSRARRPAQDLKQPVVSVREVYSARYIDDMLQYDDARRYIEMMQGRVFAAVEDFLIDHNVDTKAYEAQLTVILNNGVINNSGIVNSGQMSGVQNQPGAMGSQQQQGGA